MWVRGLKRLHSVMLRFGRSVAPHVGAWIETLGLTICLPNSFMSHPMWVRGLKHRQELEVDELTI